MRHSPLRSLLREANAEFLLWGRIPYLLSERLVALGVSVSDLENTLGQQHGALRRGDGIEVLRVEFA